MLLLLLLLLALLLLLLQAGRRSRDMASRRAVLGAVAACGAVVALALWLGAEPAEDERAAGPAAARAGSESAGEAARGEAARGARAAVETPSKELARPLTVTQLFVYPVKSLKGQSVSAATLTALGFEHDRRWMVVDSEGTFLSQRRCERMALVTPRVARDAYGRVALELSAPALMSHSIMVPLDESPAAVRDHPVRVWDDVMHGVHDQGDLAGRWLSQALGIDNLHLVYMSACTPRRAVAAAYAVRPEEDSTSFSDGFPYLICSQASLNDLNRRILAAHAADAAEGAGEPAGEPMRPLGWDRFRPNIVLSGLGPYEEDRVGSFLVLGGKAQLRVVKPCSRCKMTTIDQELGRSPRGGGVVCTDLEPLRTLATYRKHGDDVFFCENAILDAPALVAAADAAALTMRVGDTVSKGSGEPASELSQAVIAFSRPAAAAEFS